MKKFIIRISIIIGVIIAALYITDTDFIIKAIRTIYLTGHSTAFLDDYKYADNKTIKNGDPKAWPLHKNYNKIAATEKLLDLHKSQGTVAYLIIKNDSLLYEAYYDGYGEDSKSNSFSMAKSYVSGLLGKAIMDGAIKA